MAGMGEEEKTLVEDEVRVVGIGVGGVDTVDLWLTFSQVVKLLSREAT